MQLVLRRVGAVIALIVQCVIGTPTALSVTPSVQWYGDDGTWSAISLRVGTPPQWVDVMVSTVSSETWVIGPGGCTPDSECAGKRGGLFDFRDSTSWFGEGFFSLGADSQLGNSFYAEYGLDNLEFGSTGVTLPKAIIGSMNTTGSTNTTGYFIGNFGVGIVPGSFNSTTALSAISGLVEDLGVIPSHSYGFTAGAKYQGKGIPNSLTLGGYDANRFVPHGISFELNPSQFPEVFVNSISVANESFNSDLLFSTDQVFASIDSSTPYLWLPQAACERFAQVLGLQYDDTLNLYTFTANSSQLTTLQNSNLTFKFELSDISSSPDLVNITVPYAAFDLKLTYPAIPGTAYGDANATMSYFPLRQAADETQYTIGRAFLQEAYLITDYERNNFSIHQAVHTSSPIQNTSIVSITRPSSSNFEGPPSTKKQKKKPGAIIGIAIGSFAFTALLTLAILYSCRHRRQKKAGIASDKPAVQRQSLLARLRRRNEDAHEAGGDMIHPTEVGADATHERFELPAPLGPAELDSESGTLDGTTERGSSTEDSAHLTAYERARRKLERQQAAARTRPVIEEYPIEKTDVDVSTVVHYRPPEIQGDMLLVSPIAPHSGTGSGGSFSHSGAPSPVSPGFVSAPITPVSAAPPTYRRIDPANVVYAGRLPNNVRLPQVVPRMIGRDGGTIMSDESASDPESSLPGSSLGSHYTEEESGDLYSNGDTHMARIPSMLESEPRPRREFSMRGEYLEEEPDQAASRRRLEGNGEELVHVPQPAENRFSWEEERTGGTD